MTHALSFWLFFLVSVLLIFSSISLFVSQLNLCFCVKRDLEYRSVCLSLMLRTSARKIYKCYTWSWSKPWKRTVENCTHLLHFWDSQDTVNKLAPSRWVTTRLLIFLAEKRNWLTALSVMPYPYPFVCDTTEKMLTISPLSTKPPWRQ